MALAVYPKAVCGSLWTLFALGIFDGLKTVFYILKIVTVYRRHSLHLNCFFPTRNCVNIIDKTGKEKNLVSWLCKKLIFICVNTVLAWCIWLDDWYLRDLLVSSQLE